ncbi:SLC13 family permease [Synechococcus sp. Lug-A]|jgi:di/tricarboxylate transporter|uniref:SLC13 family permease n=1 Tax=unclassified Synechococcus TaxID=2626047 RepID=UPI0020CEAC4D|nr:MULTISPECIES: SLC13 family permease [unclassified Synechococcus]MCP9827094.1 SLC13 family permease [Synechococcus sp. L2F]MCP9846842.1 SLC13 family permease [Synechococcus sp. Lug-A]
MSAFLTVASEPAGLITLLIFAGAILLFITGWLAPEVTGLLAAALLVTFKVLKPDEAVQGFGSPALITLMGLFAVSAGLFRSGGLDRLRALIGSDAVRSPKRMIALMVGVVAPLSAFVPNTPIVATLLPVLEGWCHRRGISPSKVLLPLSFATVLGGTISLLGTSTNLLASDVSRQLGYGSLELFSFTAIGIPVWLIGSAYVLFFSERMLPDRGLDGDDLLGTMAREGYFTDVLIPMESELIGQSLHNSRLQRRFDVDVLELHRGSESFTAPLADQVLQAGDRLMLRCNRDNLLRLQQEHTVTLAPITDLDDGVQEPAESSSSSPQRVVEVLLPTGSTIVGSSVRDLRFRQRYNATLLAVRRGNQVLRELLGRVQLQAGDVLLLQAPLDAIRGMQANNDLVLLDELEKDLPTTSRKWVAVVISALVILLPMFKLLPLMAAVLLAVVAMVATGCLRPGELQRSIRWDVILLLGSLTSFSVAMQSTGLAEALATDLLRSMQGWSPYLVLLSVTVLAQIFTEALSNGATVVLLIPIATEVAKGLDLPPMAFIFAVMFAASQSFLTPIGYQTNLMVFGPGRYRFLDMTLYGLPLTLTLAVTMPWLICRHFGI